MSTIVTAYLLLAFSIAPFKADLTVRDLVLDAASVGLECRSYSEYRALTVKKLRESLFRLESSKEMEFGYYVDSTCKLYLDLMGVIPSSGEDFHYTDKIPVETAGKPMKTLLIRAGRSSRIERVRVLE